METKNVEEPGVRDQRDDPAMKRAVQVRAQLKVNVKMFSFLCIVIKIVYEKFRFLESLFLYRNLIHFAKEVEGENPKKNSQKLKQLKIPCPSSFLIVFLKGTNLKP